MTSIIALRPKLIGLGLLFAANLLLSPAQAQEKDKPLGAQLRAIDRVNARSIELQAEPGKPFRYGTLEILLRVCEPDRNPVPHDLSRAFIEINELGYVAGAEKRRIFSGWMIASDPALNALEHTVYDIWLIRCRT